MHLIVLTQPIINRRTLFWYSTSKLLSCVLCSVQKYSVADNIMVNSLDKETSICNWRKNVSEFICPFERSFEV